MQGYLKKYDTDLEKMYVEDLAALERLTEDTIIGELRHRLETGFSYTFIGDVLIALNSNEMPHELPRSVNFVKIMLFNLSN